MASAYYSLEEVLQKLAKTEDEVKQLIQDGKIKEYRDGSKTLFKSEEIDPLTEKEITISDEEPTIHLAPDETGEISLSPDELAQEDSGEDSFSADLTRDDTSISTAGMNVIEQGDTEFTLADSMSETSAADEDVQRLDEDVNLDSFGSGSGLLDLSLQADDTSLGAVLDDIYPTEGEQQIAAPQQEELEAAVQPAQMLEDVEEAPHEAMQTTTVYAEPAPDSQSNMFGMTLIVPLIFVFYTVIATIAGFRGFNAGLIKMTQNLIWFIAAGAALIVIIMALVAAMSGKKKAKS